jgi:glycerol-3-phosphate dehydrogenase (NAD(P)+)
LDPNSNDKIEPQNIAVIGSGGWGTALSIILSENNHNVKLWTRELEVEDEINTKRTNSKFLKGVTIPENIIATTNVDDLKECPLIVNTIPTQYIRESIVQYKLPIKGKIIINGSKGIETQSLKRISQLFKEIAGTKKKKYCVITGPSHAEEVARKMPTTVVAASANSELAKYVQSLFLTPNFRVYTSQDVVGCELGGSLKNIIAIAAGIIDGLDLGDNTKAALITRGLAEIKRLGVELGSNKLTFSGLSGLGDLIVTANSRHSRNRLVGEMIGQGKKLDEIIEHMEMVAEGVATTESAYKICTAKDVPMPIIEELYKVLFEDKDPRKAISDLMLRESKKEWWWS